MLGKNHVVVTIAVTDLKRARSFYEDKLGLPKPETRTDGVSYQLGGGSEIFIYERPGRPPKADHTLASFDVDDLEKEMKDLRSRGVTFEEYDFPGLKTKNGIAEANDVRGAWFKDPDGNILAVTQRIGERKAQPQMAGQAGRSH